MAVMQASAGASASGSATFNNAPTAVVNVVSLKPAPAPAPAAEPIGDSEATEVDDADVVDVAPVAAAAAAPAAAQPTAAPPRSEPAAPERMPTHQLAPMPAQGRPVLFNSSTGFNSMPAIERPPGKLARSANGLATLLALGVLLSGAVYFLFGDSVMSAVDPHRRSELLLPTLDGVRVLSMRAVKYPTRTGGDILVVTGEAVNDAAEARSGLWLVAELKDRRSRLVTAARAPLAQALSPSQLALAVDASALAQAFAARAAESPGAVIAPGARVGYTVVITDPPGQAASLVYGLRLEKGPAVQPAPPPPPPATPAVGEEAAAEPAADEALAKGKKGKAKKGKGKKAKTKGKGKRAGEDAALE